MLDYGKCIKLISSNFKNYKDRFTKEKDQIKKFIETIKKVDLKWIERDLPDNLYEKLEILEPLENEIVAGDKVIAVGPVDDLKENKWAFELIKNYSILAVDTSEIFTTHYYPFFILLNIGLCYYNYTNNEYYEEAEPFMFSEETIGNVDDDKSLPLIINRLRLESEIQVITKVVKEKSINNSFIFFDESFSANYLKSSNRNVIINIMNNVKNNIDSCLNLGLYPIGVIYTLSRGFINLVRNSIEIPESNISDKQVFNGILKPGQRSSIFKVNNYVTKTSGLNILAFYLKISENNVLRVEFDERLKDYANEIQKVVFLQSVIGGGYPLCMERAHEMAYISEKERVYIYEQIEEELLKQGIKSSDFGFTRKQERKIVRVI